MTIFITGANGFLGNAIVRSLLHCGKYNVIAMSRRSVQEPITDDKLQWIDAIALNSQEQLIQVLRGVQTVVHCAGQASTPDGQTDKALATLRDVNVAWTRHLAQEAAAAGVHRFVFISSIKVNGEATLPNQPFTEQNAPSPQDGYAQSKAEAEEALLALASKSSMEVVIIRPPLIYGPGVKGNFAAMIKAVRRGLPLPLGAVHNQRSLVALDNLVSLVLLCVDRERSPQAANQVFLVADEQNLSTTALLRKVAHVGGYPSRLLPVPPSLLRAGATLLGKRAIAERLLGNMCVDSTKARTLLGWRPVVTMDQQLGFMFADLNSQAFIPSPALAASFSSQTPISPWLCCVSSICCWQGGGY